MREKCVKRRKWKRQKSKTVIPLILVFAKLAVQVILIIYKRNSLHAKTFVPLFKHWW